jgi:hypothetical protein
VFPVTAAALAGAMGAIQCAISRRWEERDGKKAKTTKNASAKKTPSKKRSAKLTATDQVLKIIKRSKKGVDTPTLVKKTGFNDKKIRNILQRVCKDGRVKSAGRGKYVGA